jgi:16S rRNA (uracil1498-N3)-methyltransferase
MRTHRIHLAELTPGLRPVTGKEATHLAQVLRVAPGAPVRAFDGRGNEAAGTVVEVEPGRVVVELQEPRESANEADIAVTVAVSLLKGDKLADVVRQCTELGAFAFRPVVSRRSDVPVLSANKLERLRRVAREAAKQSGRSLVPEVFEPVRLPDLVVEGVGLVAQPNAPATLTTTDLTSAESATLITGPEGGFTAEEIGELESRGVVPVRLGARVLRAETAPVALLAALLLPEGR